MAKYIVALASALAKANIDNITEFNRRITALEDFDVLERPSGERGWMVRGIYNGTSEELREKLGYQESQIRIEEPIDHHTCS